MGMAGRGDTNKFSACIGIPGGFKCISSEDLETWPTRLEEELKTEGAVTKMLVVYGRKPDV